MNFLAHLYLSGTEPEILVGNFIGDFVKGRDFSAYPLRIQNGIELHRAIDEYTDSHPKVIAGKKRLQPGYHHYAPVIIDVFYDHFLANRWADFHVESLDEFASKSYLVIQSFTNLLPPRVKEMLPYMIRGNWLVSYGTLVGIQKALTGLSRRTTHVSHMEDAVAELKLYYHAFEAEFLQFFPDVRNFCEHWIQTNTLRNE